MYGQPWDSLITLFVIAGFISLFFMGSDSQFKFGLFYSFCAVAIATHGFFV